MEVNEVWEEIRKETRKRAEAEPVLASFFHTTVLEHDSFSSTLANHLANDLSNTSIQPMMLRRVMKEAINSSKEMISDIANDLIATKERDPACRYFSTPLLFLQRF